MDPHNFWHWLLTGLFDIIDLVMTRLPFYQNTGMATLTYNALLGALTVFALYIGSFLNLCWFIILFTIFLASEGARGAMAAYRSTVKLLPIP